MTPADLKPPKRIRDKDVYRVFHSRGYRCLHCASPEIQAAHLLRGKDREDVLAGLVPLCPSCHEAFDKALPYLSSQHGYVTPEHVKASVAHFLRHEAGEEQAAYLIARLGPFGAEDYVQRLER